MTALIRLWHRVLGRHPMRFVPGYEVRGTVHPATLICDVCEVGKPVLLPPQHPESLTKSLPADEEMRLAELDDLTWTEQVTAEVTYCRDALERVFPLDYLKPGEA